MSDRLYFGSFLLFLTLSSCVSYEELVSFRPLDPAENLSPQNIENAVDLTVQPEDLIRITVSSLDPAASLPFNEPPQQGQGGQNLGAGNSILQLELNSGYFVDDEGYLDFPVLGSIYVEGLTLSEIKTMLVERLSEDYLKNPVVNIRFLNFKVTALGEVNAPGIIRLSNKRVNVLEALGYAGDLTPYADRTTVLVIREEEGVRTFTRLNLKSEDIFSSPYFYLQQNDVIYVEPIEARIATVQDPGQRIIQYASGALSLVSIILAIALR